MPQHSPYACCHCDCPLCNMRCLLYIARACACCRCQEHRAAGQTAMEEWSEEQYQQQQQSLKRKRSASAGTRSAAASDEEHDYDDSAAAAGSDADMQDRCVTGT